MQIIKILNDSTQHGFEIGSIQKVFSSNTYSSYVADYTKDINMRILVQVLDKDVEFQEEYRSHRQCKCCNNDMEEGNLCDVCKDCKNMGLKPWDNSKEDLQFVRNGYRLNTQVLKEKLKREQLEKEKRDEDFRREYYSPEAIRKRKEHEEEMFIDRENKKIDEYNRRIDEEGCF